MRRLPQSTSRVVMLKVFLTSDHVTAATGKTVAITISKNGGAFGNPNAGATNATEVSNGWYKVTLDTTDTNTIGDLVVRGTATACDDSEQVMEVVSATTGGASNLDVASSTLATAANLATVAGYLDTEVAAILAAVDTEVATIVTQTGAAAIRTALGLASANLDTQLDALPTTAELATALGTADDAVLTAIGALSIPTANDNADALLDRANGIETGITLRNLLRGVGAMLLGKASGGQTGTEVFRAADDSKDRVTMTDDSTGNRTAVTLDLT